MPIFTKNNIYILYVHVPKTGGSSIEAMLRRNKWDQFYFDGGKNPGNLNKIRLCSPQHMHLEMLQKVFNFEKIDYAFMTVRHPVDRLISEYRMKRGSRKEVTLASWLDSALADYTKNPFCFDNHLRPQSDFWHSSFRVFKLENGYSEIIKELELKLDISFNNSNVPHIMHRDKIEGKIDKKIVNIDHELRNKIKLFYQKDFDMFDYQFDRYSKYYQDFNELKCNHLKSEKNQEKTEISQAISIKSSKVNYSYQLNLKRSTKINDLEAKKISEVNDFIDIQLLKFDKDGHWFQWKKPEFVFSQVSETIKFPQEKFFIPPRCLLVIPKLDILSDDLCIYNGKLLLDPAVMGAELSVQSRLDGRKRTGLNALEYDYYHKDEFINFYNLKRRRIDSTVCVVVNSPFAHMYGHWLLDVVPRIALAKNIYKKDAKFLVSSKLSSYTKRFEKVLDLDENDWEFFASDKEIVTISHAIVPAYLRYWTLMHPSCLEMFEEIACRAEDRISRKLNRKLFISRQRVGSRCKNENEIAKIAEDYGFDIIFPELMPVEEQIKLFRNAEIIVGTRGSALHNSVFASEKCRFLIIQPGDDKGLIQPGLCQLKKQEYGLLFGSYSENGSKSNYYVRPDLFIRAIKSML